jgi:glycosyltransferase involved in cell wall biosynthesis
MTEHQRRFLKLMSKVIVIMPAYNAARTLERTYRDIPMDVVDQVILVDDVSHDETVEVARRLGITTLIHRQNKGYGGNQKTCYIEALRAGADVVVMLHPDHQYDSRQIPELIAPLLEGRADMVLGTRLNDGKALARGMPVWKYLSNRFLTAVENLVLGTSYTEFHTGFRAYTRRFLLTVPFLLNSDNFVFDTEMIAQARAQDMRIAEVFTPARYFDEASSVDFRTSTVYGLQTLWVMLTFLLHRWGVVGMRKFSLSLREIVSPYHWEEIHGREVPGRVVDEHDPKAMPLPEQPPG